MSSVLEIRDVHRAYRQGEDVLRGVSLSIEAGQVVGLLGRNGAGKTTLIKLAMGMIAAQSGSVRLFGMDPMAQPVEVKRRVGYVAEDQTLPPHFGVDAVVELHRELFPSWDEALCVTLMKRFSLPRWAKISSLSKGQARQVALLCAVAHRPDLLLLDEPAGGLDPVARREFLETSIDLLAESGTAILFSSHHMADVERMAERIAMLHGGRVLLDTDLEQLREQHCLVMFRPQSVNREQLQALDGCLGVRKRPGALHAVFGMAPEDCRVMLADALELHDARFVRLGLEEMFIELAGGQA
jgi:ABC-2 type transport system ATP-binding protein